MATYSEYSNVVNAMTFETETQTLLARASSAPSAALAALINTTIKGLKDDGVFAKGDCLYVRGVHESTLALQNWIKNAHNGTLSATAPVFTAKEGFKGGTNKYINNNYNPYTQGDKFTLTSETIAMMATEIGGTNATNPLGSTTTVGGNRFIYMNYRTANTEQMYMGVSATANGYANLTAGKYLTYTKTGNTVLHYEDGTAYGFSQAVTNADQLPDTNMYELAYSAAGTPVGYWDGELAFTFYGGYLNGAETDALYDRVKYFFDNVGGTF